MADYSSPEWREAQRRKHRYMTWAEYRAWCFAGDGISYPSSAESFPGGLTIDFSGPPMLGRVDE